MKKFSLSMVVKIGVIILLLGIIMYGGTVFAGPIRQEIAIQFHRSSTEVKGASTKSQLPADLKKDVASQAANLKKGALNIKVSDVVGFFGRAKKIVDDAKNVASNAATQVGKILPHK